MEPSGMSNWFRILNALVTASSGSCMGGMDVSRKNMALTNREGGAQLARQADGTGTVAQFAKGFPSRTRHFLCSVPEGPCNLFMFVICQSYVGLLVITPIPVVNVRSSPPLKCYNDGCAALVRCGIVQLRAGSFVAIKSVPDPQCKLCHIHPLLLKGFFELPLHRRKITEGPGHAVRV